MRFARLLAPLLVAASSFGTAAATDSPHHEVLHGLDEQAGLAYWQWVGAGISLTLVQRAPDQTRSFFEARGFGPKLANLIAQQCVFKTIFSNTGEQTHRGAVDYDLNEWRVVVGDERRPLSLKGAWAQRWQKLGATARARIAFRWAMLPTQQRFEAGDNNWGMTSFGLPAGHRFDLEFVWRRGGKRYTGRIEGLLCARDAPVALKR